MFKIILFCIHTNTYYLKMIWVQMSLLAPFQKSICILLPENSYHMTINMHGSCGCWCLQKAGAVWSVVENVMKEEQQLWEERPETPLIGSSTHSQGWWLCFLLENGHVRGTWWIRRQTQWQFRSNRNVNMEVVISKSLCFCSSTLKCTLWVFKLNWVSGISNTD